MKKFIDMNITTIEYVVENLRDLDLDIPQLTEEEYRQITKYFKK